LPVKYSDRGALKTAFFWHEEILREMAQSSNILGRVKLFFAGKVKNLIKEFEKDMKNASMNKQFEKAALFRDRIRALEHIREIAIFRKEESEQLRFDVALSQLKKMLQLKNIPCFIEAYDISNIFGKEAVGSLVAFRNGLPDKNNYKRFKIKTVKGIDDYQMIQEVLKRRFQKKDKLPDLILIDGGKGQLNAALKVLEDLPGKIDVISIAKRNEEIFVKVKNNFQKIVLEKDSPELLLIERIRDEAHRFAIIYHRLLRAKKGRASELDNISGIGEKTKKKLMKKFKTIENIKKTSVEGLIKIVGPKLAKMIKKELF